VERSPIQAFAALWCVLMAAALVGVRLAGWAIPLWLLAIFCGVWLFGAAMLWWVPRFGAVGTALYGVLLSASLLSMHGAIALNVALASGFLLAAILALAVLWTKRSERA
jgi:hypothetical protein